MINPFKGKIMPIALFLIFLMAIYGYYQNWSVIKENNALNAKIENLEQSTDMYRSMVMSNGNNATPSGLYFNSTICMYIKGRTWSEVMETASHEYLHYKHPDHFR